MAQAFADKSPAGRLLDLALFAPLGLALSVGEALPELARKGRARLEPQLGVARTVGQLAVGQGKRQLFDLLPFKPGLPGTGRFGSRPGGPATSSPSVPGSRTVPSASSPVRRPAGGVAGAGEPLRPVVRRPPDSETAAGHTGPSRLGATHTGAGPAGTGHTVPGHGTSDDAAPGAGDGAVRQTVAGRRAGRAGAQRGPAQLAIPSYDALSASQVVQRLAGLSREEVRAVRSYEASTRGRRTILSKADQLLA